MPWPSLVIMALVSGFTLNCNDGGNARLLGTGATGATRLVTSSATYLITAVNGAPSGTLTTLNGSFGSDASTILKETLADLAAEG